MWATRSRWARSAPTAESATVTRGIQTHLPMDGGEGGSGLVDHLLDCPEGADGLVDQGIRPP
ncbi:hypothetical protein D2E54_23745 [Mycobacteroides abscessus]|nr:hypothetical protein D2E54_23745 [Mycobacteroides abscessus]